MLKGRKIAKWAGAMAIAISIATMLWCGAAGAATVHVASQLKASGTVASVNGTNVAGTCGGGRQKAGTSPNDPEHHVHGRRRGEHHHLPGAGVSAPSFDIVCVGDRAQAVGTLSSSAVRPPPRWS